MKYIPEKLFKPYLTAIVWWPWNVWNAAYQDFMVPFMYKCMCKSHSQSIYNYTHFCFAAKKILKADHKHQKFSDIYGANSLKRRINFPFFDLASCVLIACMYLHGSQNNQTCSWKVIRNWMPWEIFICFKIWYHP